jgi:hypothetical protein
MYADDLSLYAVVNSDDDYIKFQEDLNKLCKWCNDWSLNINFGKCNAIHFGYSNKKYVYNLCDNVVKDSCSEKVLGITIDTSLCFKEHIFMCVKKAYYICNLISSNFKYANCDILIKLYKCYVRPVLEYGSVIYSPHNLYLIDTIERVQRRFTKNIPGLYNMNYCDRLRVCNIESLELRRIYSDLVMVYKILHGLICVNLNDNLLLSKCITTRGNKYKLTKHCVKLDIRKYFFSERIVNIWNYLSDDVVSSSNINVFKSKLYKIDLSRFLKGRALYA